RVRRVCCSRTTSTESSCTATRRPRGPATICSMPSTTTCRPWQSRRATWWLTATTMLCAMRLATASTCAVRWLRADRRVLMRLTAASSTLRRALRCWRPSATLRAMCARARALRRHARPRRRRASTTAESPLRLMLLLCVLRGSIRRTSTTRRRSPGSSAVDRAYTKSF
ncbi:hypothetical protein FBU31_003359, partial [Coemansia sp. 'formosensis']